KWIECQDERREEASPRRKPAAGEEVRGEDGRGVEERLCDADDADVAAADDQQERVAGRAVGVDAIVVEAGIGERKTFAVRDAPRGLDVFALIGKSLERRIIRGARQSP